MSTHSDQDTAVRASGDLPPAACVRWRQPVARPLLAALAALLALLMAGDPSMAAGPMPMHAIVLVAQPNLQDSSFVDSVVLVMNNMGPAPEGVIVNRPTPIPVAKLFPQMKTLVALPDRIYFGGPVEVDSVWFLVRAPTAPEHALQTCPGLYISASRTLLLSLLARKHPMENLRIFLGHSGWAPGQLEDEIAAGAWKLEEASAATIFSRDEHAWPTPAEPKSHT
jgi:putative transcriptional regulator